MEIFKIGNKLFESGFHFFVTSQHEGLEKLNKKIGIKIRKQITPGPIQRGEAYLKETLTLQRKKGANYFITACSFV
jgi:hypothetical protein